MHIKLKLTLVYLLELTNVLTYVLIKITFNFKTSLLQKLIGWQWDLPYLHCLLRFSWTNLNEQFLTEELHLRLTYVDDLCLFEGSDFIYIKLYYC